MGVDYSAKIIYGLPADDAPELLDDSNGDYLYYDKGLDRASSYYDSDSSDWIIGVVIASSRTYAAKEINLACLPEALEQAKKKFFEATGKEGRLYISPHGS